jgi:hypothetical protein
MVAFADAQILDVVGPLEVFSRAARLLTDEGKRGPLPYAVEILAPRRGRVVTSSGIPLLANRSFREVRGGVDTLFVSGGRGTEAALRDRALIQWLRRMAPRVDRLASVCTGAFILAEAGLLDGPDRSVKVSPTVPARTFLRHGGSQATVEVRKPDRSVKVSFAVPARTEASGMAVGVGPWDDAQLLRSPNLSHLCPNTAKSGAA